MEHQQEFDLKYITPAEIETRYGLASHTLTRQRDRIPGAVKVAGKYIYVRAVAEPVLATLTPRAYVRRDV